MSSSWKIFFSPIRESGWLLDSLWLPERKNVPFLLSRHDARRVHEKFSSRRFERGDGCKSHFGLLSPKTFDSYFLDMMYVEFIKILLSPIPMSYWLLDSFWLPETKNVSFLLSRHDLRRVHEKFSSRDLSERMAVRLIFSSWAQKRLILLSRHDVRRVHEKFSFRRFEREDGC